MKSLVKHSQTEENLVKEIWKELVANYTCHMDRNGEQMDVFHVFPTILEG